jgi:hypothetical protein
MEKPTGPIGSFFPELFKLVSRRVKNQRWLGMVQVGFQEQRVKNQRWLGMVQVGFQEGTKPERSRPAI